MNKTAILGFGNPARSDDGIGIYVVNQLQQKLSENQTISVFDMGTSAFEILFKLKGHSKYILVDAVINSNESPGTLFKIPTEEVEKAPMDDPLVFLHGLKWDQALSYAKKMLGEDYPKDIEVYLIAIDNTKFSTDISEEVLVAGNRLIDTIIQEVK